MVIAFIESDKGVEREYTFTIGNSQCCLRLKLVRALSGVAYLHILVDCRESLAPEIKFLIRQ
jgi:hypothetical protein